MDRPRRNSTAPIAVMILFAVSLLVAARLPSINVEFPKWPNPDIAAPATSPSAQATPRARGGSILRPSTPSPSTRPTAGLKEGFDFSFIAKANGRPVKWSCDATISVAISGPAPYGAQQALALALEMLRTASALPLVVAEPNTDSAITVYYGEPGETRKHQTLTENALGVGGPKYNSEGTIESGLVLIRNGLSTDPTTIAGQQVLSHELAHALGLGHADQSTGQLMTPNFAPIHALALGPGDKTALAAVGC